MGRNFRRRPTLPVFQDTVALARMLGAAQDGLTRPYWSSHALIRWRDRFSAQERPQWWYLLDGSITIECSHESNLVLRCERDGVKFYAPVGFKWRGSENRVLGYQPGRVAPHGPPKLEIITVMEQPSRLAAITDLFPCPVVCPGGQFLGQGK